MAINIKSQWGIIENDENAALQNSCAFITNFENLSSPAELYLPAGTYWFNMMYFTGTNSVEFYGDTNASGEPTTIIKFKSLPGDFGKWCEDSDKKWTPSQCFLKIANADNFNIHGLAFDGRMAEDQGGVWAHDGSTNGTLKNLKVYDAAEVSLVVGGTSSTNPAHDVNVENCKVYGQRKWSGNAKAMILAGGYGYNITFRNCKTYSVSPYNNDYYSPADHFDTDNAINVEYHNCVADGSGLVNNDKDRKGTGFWNEAGGVNSEDHETSSTYYDCEAKKTGGGLGSAENSDVKAFNFTFKECSGDGWAVWARCCGNFELYDSLFDKCASIGGGGIRRGGFVIEGAPKDKFIKFKRNTFINTPEGSPHYDNINLYSDAAHKGNIEIIDNTFDDNVTANPNSIAENPVSVHWNIFGGSDSDLNKNEDQTNYTWNILKAARTTAINSPTSDATVIFSYGGHSTSVSIPSGTNIGTMLSIMEGTINNDSDAKITAEGNSKESTLTFKQKSSNSDTAVSIYHDFTEWQNGAPFDDMQPQMQP